MNKNANHEIKFDGSKTIIVTKKFLKAASVMGTPEYRELKKLLQENPGYTVVERKINQKASRTTYHELTYAVMQNIIEDVYKDDEEMKGKKIAEFKDIQEMFAFNNTTKYGHVKAWFVKNYKQAYLDRYESQAKTPAA